MATTVVSRYVDMPEKVTLKKFRRNGWLPPDHDGSINFTGTHVVLTVQRDRHTGVFHTGLNEDDERRLEKAMNLPVNTLSRYNKDFWSQDKFNIKIPKNGVVLHRDNPKDELIWRVCMDHQQVAKSEKERDFTDFAEFVLISEAEETREINQKLDTKQAAFDKLRQMSIQDMINFLYVFGKNPGTDPKPDFVKAEVGKVMDNEPEKFLEIVGDPGYKTKLFIKECVGKNIIKENGTKYVLHGGDIIGYSLAQAVEYLQNPDNQKLYVELRKQLEATK